MRPSKAIAAMAFLALASAAPPTQRAREAGVVIGVLPPGPLNAITDVAGVRVGQVTIEEGKDVHTGVTAILPHDGNVFRSRVPAGFNAFNAFGKFAGSTQVAELGEIETPILLTNTLNVSEAVAASVEWTLARPGNETVRSVNAVVGETNDGLLNDIRRRRVTIADARRAIENAKGGAVEEGSVGAGTGTVCFGFKCGIGTASRRLPASLGGWTLGVLVQTNYGGVLNIAGVPVGIKLGRYEFKGAIDRGTADGSVVVVIATDAPLSDRNLRRIAERAFIGIGRTGSSFSNGSGDYAIALFDQPLSASRGGWQGGRADDRSTQRGAFAPVPGRRGGDRGSGDQLAPGRQDDRRPSRHGGATAGGESVALADRGQQMTHHFHLAIPTPQQIKKCTATAALGAFPSLE